eukprot:CAMPEP_0173328136 /NCGR_PEP_ID=MMETSP1144-20121109/1993_1 /TAXON_ID=483371 /ORGANISM="non described non described, Strain CCMP2298" /LENGTH=81 /DNA_ID=CAMNT_0014272603 /DNA_START=33 /DNA_END=274 /DNA_ORIENTATION=-
MSHTPTNTQAMSAHTVDSLLACLQSIERQVEGGSKRGPMVRAQEVLWSMHTGDMADLLVLQERGGGFEVYSGVLEDVRGLL